MSKHYLSTAHASSKCARNAVISSSPTVILVLSVFFFSNPALADDVIGAAKAFSRAQKAELTGNFAMAAEFFELADSLSPSPEALRSAVRSRKAAGQLSTAALHAETLRDRYPNDAKSQQLANATLTLAEQTLTRVEIECKPRACTLLIIDPVEFIAISPTPCPTTSLPSGMTRRK